MLSTSLSLWLGLTFLLVGAINVWLILQSSARVKNAQASSRLVAAHRVGGYIFIALFAAMAYFMVSRLGDIGNNTSPTTMIHLTLAMVLSPLLFVKVLVARYYKSYYGFLMPIGLVIFVLAFVLIGITAGPYVAHQGRIQTVSLDDINLPPASIDVNLAAETMQKRCSKCHNLDRIVGARKGTGGWLATVKRMQAFPNSGISDQDARIIVSYLASQMEPKGSRAAASLEVARAVVDQRCGRCHSLDRVYRTAETPEEWAKIVARMAGYAAGSSNALQPGEQKQITDYLSATQTPDAVKQRKSKADAASSDQIPPAQQAAAITPPPASRGYDGKLIGFLSFVAVGTVGLIIRRPKKAAAAAAKSEPVAAVAPERPDASRLATSPSSAPLILKLVRTTRQTSDAKTLRFVVSNEQKFIARPGQFLTFCFLFDGKKVSRSYSICSSTARSGYVEITPKRVNNGCVSVFLNDRAQLGMTVEANGPFGQFYFDETKHQQLVLLAAGSGITPMIAMLRYIDDLCLDTPATLLYCVRTRSDIIFHRELEELKTRLNNFRYHLLLSQPDAEWAGPRGHVSREFVEDRIKHHKDPVFFLCGPPPFMEACHGVLTGLDVKPERIKQESFGSSLVPKRMKSDPAEPEPGAVIVFARSGKSCTVRRGQSLLEAAEEHGVAIPFSCRQGQCGTCKTKLFEGSVRMDAEHGLDQDSKAQGFVLTCVGYAQGAVKLDA